MSVGQFDARPQGASFLQPGDDAAGGLGRLLADRLDDRLVKLLDNSQIDERPGDRQLQPELLADLPGELQDDVRECAAITAVSSRLLDGPAEFLIDHPLHPFQPRRGRELLLDDVVRAFEGDHAGGQLAHPLEALVDGGFADAEVTGGVGLRVAGIEIGAQPRRPETFVRAMADLP